jgi:transcriptional regulator with XRE-family HTH domain
LRRLRLEHGLSQRELAERAGLNKSTINGLERGLDARYPSMRRLAAALNVSTAELLGPENQTRPAGELDRERG